MTNVISPSTPYGPTNHLGLVDYDVNQIDSNTQNEINNLPRAESNDPQTRDQLQERQELNRQAVSRYRWENQDELTKARLGRILSQSEFLRLLRKVRPDACYNNFSADGRIGINVVVRDEQGERRQYTGTTVQLGWSPEFSTMYTDERGLPTREKYRGWRTTLLHLIGGGFITEEQALKAFGEPTPGFADRYLKQLYAIRNAVKN